MSTGVVEHTTEIGPIALAYVECDYCHDRWPDDTPRGLLLERRGYIHVGQWERRDFCTIEHLALYFEPDAEGVSVRQ